MSVRPKLKNKRYLSTSIPFVNGAPHIGFVLELVQADALARVYRVEGDEVHFQTGTDENSIKNVRAADSQQLDVVELVEGNAKKFKDLSILYNISVNEFVRTSSDQRHRLGVEKLWNDCLAAGDIYKRPYQGLYCVGCEQFYTEEELNDGCCKEHHTPVEVVEEENWFFRLSRYAEKLELLIKSSDLEIVPTEKKNEILSFLKGGLNDLSISRSSTRARRWGIPVPNDESQVIYVWFDALANYVTALRYGQEHALMSDWWIDVSHREHLLGKGISRFHAVYWPAILLAVGLPVPTRIFVHGYVTVDGKKIGKSLGNSVDPVPLALKYGADPVRYYLLRHIKSTSDGDFSTSRLNQAYSSELAGQLGNLVHRVLSMVEKYRGSVVPPYINPDVKHCELYQESDRLWETVTAHCNQFSLDLALDSIFKCVVLANRFVSEHKPWELATLEQVSNCDLVPQPRYVLSDVLYLLIRAISQIAYALYPFMPDTSDLILSKLGYDVRNNTFELGEVVGRKILVGNPLFPKI